jgi:predicted nucleic acid-binding protein
VGTPDLYVWEVANALWKYHRFHSVPREQCHGALLQALELPDEYLGGPEFAPEVFALACELSLTAYDAR